jgi:APA family basic amino acid/polyamine antiporter
MKRAPRRRRHAPKLKRDIDFLTAVFYGVGIILGAGVYALIGEAAGLAGNALWISFIMGALVASFTGLSYMELISMFPRAAAEYVYVKNAFRNRMLAFNVGWVAIISSIIATSAVALGFAGYFNALTGLPIVPVAVALVAVMSAVNYAGIKESSRMNMVFCGIELCGLLIVVATAMVFGGSSVASVDYFEMPRGISGVLGAAALMFFAYLGFEELANLAEETKDARRTLPKALLVSVAVTTALYIMVGISVVSLVGWQELAASNAPLALAVSTLFGDNAFLLMSVIALFAISNTVLVGLIVSSRTIFGMAASGSLPRFLAKVDRSRGTPWAAIAVSMAVSIAFIFTGRIALVASVTDIGVFYMFFFVNAAVVALRYKIPNARRAFRTPLNIGKMPLTPLFGMVSIVLLASHLQMDALLAGVGLVVAGTAAYVLLDRRNRLRI